MNWIPKEAKGSLYDPNFEHDACGVGFVTRSSATQTHDIVTMALEAVKNLSHRGALDADGKSGDGAGILVQIPKRFMAHEARKLGFRLDVGDRLGVAMAFLPPAEPQTQQAREIIERKAQARGLQVLAWRSVTVDMDELGEKARSTAPKIEQLLVLPPEKMDDTKYEQTLYLVRKEAETQFTAQGLECYLPSFSHRTLIYKGLMVAGQIPKFYLDLQDPTFESALALFHQRYSTNTFPTWHLAQPFRMLAHNGEINTLQGNTNWMRAREPELESEVWGADVKKLSPIIVAGGSDSAMLDNALEAIVLSGRDVRHAMLMLVPEAWERMPHLDPAWREFYEYHTALIEPWDGPAALAFTDGKVIAATLDRNGLRPLRYKVQDDGLIVAASEVGVVEMDDAHIVEKGRLAPGQMIAVDTERGKLLKNEEIMAEVVGRQPYGEWLKRNVTRLATPTSQNGHHSKVPEDLTRTQRAFGMTSEDVKMILATMGNQGLDPVWSMGDDTPLAILSQLHRPLPFYFKQRFAQVTNPPIDPLREELVMSLDCYLGRRPSIFEETEQHAKLVHLASPLLDGRQMEALKGLKEEAFAWKELPAYFAVGEGKEGLERAAKDLCEAACRAVDEGATLLVLSDRGVGANNAPIPMLLATAAVHHHLIREGRRMKAELICETGSAWDIHHIALLIGYGANAVYPYLALATVSDLVTPKENEKVKESDAEPISIEEAEANFRQAVQNGLLKIMSKMGISTLRSYRGGQIFEVIGLAQDVVDRYFTGTPARLGGIGLLELAEDILGWHEEAYGDALKGKLPDIGYVHYRRDGEYHAFRPQSVKALQKAVTTGDYDQYKVFASMIQGGPARELRDLLALRSDRQPIPVAEVEPMEEIRLRFSTAAMSMGALSPIAHKTLAIAMNRMGGKSNTGEGGEDRDWYQPFPNGDSANSRIKQVASARFGVTTEYLANADELEIKIAQGSKPGEGGQLPGAKVSAFIASVRHAITGIPLISPPPHHDIYSIEDIAQLIHDLKQVNPRARVGVKLVAESGVGTIAAGVAKAYADYVKISGDSGGTGASPLSSIKNAGCPWELGLAETQQVLMLNGLRGRVRVRTDGGLKTGRDIVVAALLGADEFDFGTAALVSIGCDMARQCHLNTCPTGIATQREDLLEKFTGTPEAVINYFTFIAEDVREIMASLGYSRLDDIIGRVDLLAPMEEQLVGRAAALNLDAILKDVDPSGTLPRHCMQPRNDRNIRRLDHEVIVNDITPALETGEGVSLAYDLLNSDLTVGAGVAGAIAERYGIDGLPDETVRIDFFGTAGQSFGAFCTNGMRIALQGEANDYVGKGMSGGEIVIKPTEDASFAGHENVIIGNVVLYGATGGKLFAAGRAGERFAVRNSGAIAVVEGTGDHTCEYMTKGVVVVLGSTGRNFGAGMSNGYAYVLDEDDSFPRKYNPELVDVRRLEPAEELFLQSLIGEHRDATGSPRANEILYRWDRYLPLFWKVVPRPVAYKIDGHVDAHSSREESAEEVTAGESAP